MNERIFELAKQAWKEVLSETSIDGDTSNVYSPDEVVAFEQKFAELIVRECIAAHEDYYGGDIIGDVLKKHFGVKE
jgi:hypothetical protein